jgi:hypothetical protein
VEYDRVQHVEPNAQHCTFNALAQQLVALPQPPDAYELMDVQQVSSPEIHTPPSVALLLAHQEHTVGPN